MKEQQQTMENKTLQKNNNNAETIITKNRMKTNRIVNVSKDESLLIVKTIGHGAKLVFLFLAGPETLFFYLINMNAQRAN